MINYHGNYEESIYQSRMEYIIMEDVRKGLCAVMGNDMMIKMIIAIYRWVI